MREALTERGILKQNAPQLVHSQAFIVPCYSFRQKVYYGTGLKIYNLLSGKYGFGKSKILSRNKTLEFLPNIKQANLSGGIIYYDGQFDDARLLIELAKTAAEKGALLLNYARVFGLTKNNSGKIDGVDFEDAETGELFSIKAKIVINATGAFTDQIRRFSNKKAKEIISPSQGIHLVFDKAFLDGKDAVMIPKTVDGRVLFIIPWHGKTVIGTTDTPIKSAVLEPQPLEKEIEFILETCKDYLAKPPTRADIKSVFVGIRPLVKSSGTKNTAKLSRDHTIEIDDANLLTLTGGKWTTYRNMAEDAIDRAIKTAGLPDKKCVTEKLKIFNEKSKIIEEIIKEKPASAAPIHKEFSYLKAEIIYAVRFEMARTVEDILARRTRILFLDARAAIASAETVAEIMAEELEKNKNWIKEQIEEFEKIAENYLVE